MAVFHAHGGDDAQYLIGYPRAANARQNIEEVKRFVRSKLRSAKRRGNYEEAREYYLENYGIPESWIEDVFDEERIREDSLYNAYLDIYSPDVKSMDPQADVIVFDECYNGQFFKKDYISGTYVFGEGNTVAGVANTVNVRQDIWANELLGLLRHGVPLGEWHLSRNYLESHIIGDPTFHFAQNRRRSPADYSYRRLLRSEDDALRTYGVYRLARERGEDAKEELLSLYNSDPSANVRLEALLSLASLRVPEFYELLKTGIGDPSELIRRISANLMGKAGRADYFPFLAERYFHDISERVSFASKTALELLLAGPATDSLYVKLKASGELNEEQIERLDYSQERSKKWLYEDIIAVIKDSSQTARKRMSKIRTFRNYNFASGIPDLLDVALNPENPPEVRGAAVEALGWFTMNPGYKHIIDELQQLCACDAESVRKEAVKSIKRLEHGPNVVVTP
jgi:HEAT repeat protein